MSMSDDSIDYNLFSMIEPPAVYPATPHALNARIQQKFYQQCLNFLSSQKKLHSISSRIQQRLSSSISDSVSLDLHINQSVEKLQRIARELKKISQHYQQAQQKQQFLASVCKFVNMEQARKIMLEPKISDQAKFLQKLQEVGQISQQVSGLNSDIKIITQIKQQISTLMQQAVDKLIKGSISENLIQKITSSHAQIFLRDPKISAIFLSSLANHRLNLFRVGLNPLINNINYVQNLSQLFEKIIEQWLKMLDNEIRIFQKQSTPKQIRNITRDVMLKLLAEVIPKMERGIYKMKNLVQVSKIRACMMQLKATLDKCLQSEVLWDPLPKLLMKMLIILEQGLQAEAQKLETAKYNIYSLVSYIPIREHLEMIKQSKSYDPENKDLNWQRGFKRLAGSRDPSKQPNNKSLIIFNLNIWYLYSHLMKPDGELIDKADNMIKEGVNGLVGLNLGTIKKDYDIKNMQKLLDLCSDVQALKKILYSQIILLGHEKLRQVVQQEIDNRFIKEVYIPMLQAHKLEQGLNNVQVVQLCKKEKLNLNKYGKVSQTLKIFTAEQMQQLIK